MRACQQTPSQAITMRLVGEKCSKLIGAYDQGSRIQTPRLSVHHSCMSLTNGGFVTYCAAQRAAQVIKLKTMK